MTRIRIKDLPMDVKIGKKEWMMILGGSILTYKSLAPFTNVSAYQMKTDDKGRSTIQFGDGIQGARPSSGSNNISASYGSGGGSND